MLTTVAYQLGPKQPAVYALEGAVSIAGQCVRWLRDNMNFFQEAQEIGMGLILLILESNFMIFWFQNALLGKLRQREMCILYLHSLVYMLPTGSQMPEGESHDSDPLSCDITQVDDWIDQLHY